MVAFGVQKKESVIGSITTINPKELKVPVQQPYYGARRPTGRRIATSAVVSPVRTTRISLYAASSTFGNNTRPLILIDGIELTTTDLARLQPDDIASFSIMKDATATSLDGARGANGVILVTTKQGVAGKPRSLSALRTPSLHQRRTSSWRILLLI